MNQTSAATDGAQDRSGLRILMVAPQPFFRARGTPFSVLHRIRALVQSGHEVDLVTYPFGEDVALPGLRILRCARPPFVGDVKIGPSIAKLVLDVPLYFATVKALREHRYDVLHSHEEAAFFAVRLARRYGIPHVYDMHSSLPQQLKNFRAYDFGFIRRPFDALEQRVLRTCDGVITICAELADIALAHCGSTPHSMIENTADDTIVFGNAANDPRAEYNLADKDIVLYTGTFEPYQGLDLLLSAFAKVSPEFPRAHLLMVGGRPEQVEHYEALAKAHNILDAVTFVGSVHPSKIPGFLTAADIIASPRSSGTNTPLKIYGYMRSNCPILATDLLTHTQTLDAEVACLVTPTTEAFADGLKRLLSDPALRERLATSAATRSEEQFSDAAYVAKVRDLYQRVLRARTDKESELPMVAES